MQTCERCGKQALAHTMSYFNTQTICIPCSDKEREHPQFKAARAAEEAQVRAGNYNYAGVGKPADL